MVLPKLSRPRRGSSLGRICLKLCNFDSSVVRSVSIHCYSDVKVKSFLRCSTAIRSALMMEIASSYGFRSIWIAMRQESSVRKISISFRNTTLPFKGWADGSAVVTLSMHPITMRIYILVAILRRQDCNSEWSFDRF